MLFSAVFIGLFLLLIVNIKETQMVIYYKESDHSLS